MGSTLQVTLLEPFWGGSHRAAAEGWRDHTRHAVRIESLPARFWKWRMRGAAFEFARRLHNQPRPDVVVASSLMDWAHLKAIWGNACPCLLYFHENQVAYPTRPEAAGERDLQYAFTNLASAAAADHVAFNSDFQRTAFFSAMDALLKRMPDVRPRWVLRAIEAKSSVLSLGVDADSLRPVVASPGSAAPLVLWNHRWEHDKAPEVFFRVMGNLARRGIPFRLAVAGEPFARIPAEFSRAREDLAAQVVHWGYVPTRAAYYQLLLRADFVVSTAWQENFGLSMIEAACAGAHPLAPRRLSYPEVFPRELHAQCLYRDEVELEEILGDLLAGRRQSICRDRLHQEFRRYGWQERVVDWDECLAQVSCAGGL